MDNVLSIGFDLYYMAHIICLIPCLGCKFLETSSKTHHYHFTPVLFYKKFDCSACLKCLITRFFIWLDAELNLLIRDSKWTAQIDMLSLKMIQNNGIKNFFLWIPAVDHPWPFILSCFEIFIHLKYWWPKTKKRNLMTTESDDRFN